MNIKKYISITFLKFVIVGIANTLFGTAIMLILYNYFNCNYWLSSAANYLFGSILSFILNKRFTFKNTDRSLKIIIKFVLNICVCYLLAYGLAKPLVRAILQGQGQTFQENVSMLIGVVIFTFLNYFGQKYFAFK